MGRSVPLVIGKEHFASREAAKVRVRKLIGAYEFGDFLGEDDLSFCMDLFKHHTQYTEKIGSGVRAIQVRRDEQGNRYFHIHRLDGTDVDISWVHCITPKKDATVVLEALRSAVKVQIQKAKDEFVRSGAICPFYGVMLNHSNSHVDHSSPTFEEIVAMFLEHEHISLADIKVEEQQGNDFRGLPADYHLRGSWVDFHACKARLRLISSTANLSDARKKC